jgi:hypothetical protein
MGNIITNFVDMLHCGICHNLLLCLFEFRYVMEYILGSTLAFVLCTSLFARFLLLLLPPDGSVDKASLVGKMIESLLFCTDDDMTVSETSRATGFPSWAACVPSPRAPRLPIVLNLRLQLECMKFKPMRLKEALM